MDNEITNNYEIRVWGLQRSGIHAIINWIVEQSGGLTLFVNDIRSSSRNPFERKRDFHWYNADSCPKQIHTPLPLQYHKTLRRHRLILGYEDIDISHLPDEYDGIICNAVGKSKCIQNLIIVRDPFNLFASRMGFHNNANRHPMKTHRDYLIHLWKIYSHEFINDSHFLKRRTIPVNYNQWFVNLDYRRLLATALGLAFTDRGLNSVPGVALPKTEFARFGCGSSFDNQRFHGRAQEMGVLERWKLFVGEPFYTNIFHDAEVIHLSDRIFGEIPGTNILIPRKQITAHALIATRMAKQILNAPDRLLKHKRYFPMRATRHAIDLQMLRLGPGEYMWGEKMLASLRRLFDNGVISPQAFVAKKHGQPVRREFNRDSTIYPRSPRIGLIIGTYAAVPYIHLQLEILRRNNVEIPILVSDDGSPHQNQLKAICDEYGAAFRTNEFRRNKFGGDMSVFAEGLSWADRLGLDILVKFSRRWIPLFDWRPELLSLVYESQMPTFSNRCCRYNFGFRTECIAMHVPTWIASGCVETLQKKIDAKEFVCVEGFMHKLARKIFSDYGCALAIKYDARCGKSKSYAAYADWKLMGTSRCEIPKGVLWHNCHPPAAYHAYSLALNFPYTVQDFAAPNNVSVWRTFQLPTSFAPIETPR